MMDARAHAAIPSAPVPIERDAAFMPERWQAFALGKVGASVLVVDDDAALRLLVSHTLEADGFDVTEARSGPEALSMIADIGPDLLILDVGLPGMSGLDVLRIVRGRSRLPVLVLTGRDKEADRVVALELGADDYVIKPCFPRELAARVRSLLRRATPVDVAERLEFGDLIIDRATREVRVRGQLVRLTAREFDLLAYLAASPRRVLSREQLLRGVWDSSGEWQDPDTVTEHVRRLRRKIEIAPNRPRWIRTVRGAGYRFEPDAESPDEST